VGGLDGAARFVEHLELFQLSASLGSVESLVVHPASMWKAMLTEEQLADAGLDPGLVRLACGQEDVADLIEDVDKALDSLHIAFR
jgi:methionine-gamma-lyase